MAPGNFGSNHAPAVAYFQLSEGGGREVQLSQGGGAGSENFTEYYFFKPKIQ